MEELDNEELNIKIEECLNKEIDWKVFTNKFYKTAECVEKAMKDIANYYYNKGKETQ